MLTKRLLFPIGLSILVFTFAGLRSAFSQASGGNSVFVDFNQYANFTPVTDLSEPHLTFTTNGVGLSRVLSGQLQVNSGGASISIAVDQPAASVFFTYSLAGACAENVQIQLLNAGTVVDNFSESYCGAVTNYNRTIPFDTIVVTTAGVSNTEDIRIDNLAINIPGLPTVPPTATFTATATLTATPTITPTSTVAVPPGAIFVDFDKYPDFTDLQNFSEPHLTFSTNGAGLARVISGQFQIRGDGETVTIAVDSPATSVSFDYMLAGNCDGSAQIALYNAGSIVGGSALGYCAPGGTFSANVTFDTIVIATPGFGNINEIRIDNLIIIPSTGAHLTKTPKPTDTPKPTKTPKPTDTPKPSKTPKPTDTPRPTATV